MSRHHATGRGGAKQWSLAVAKKYCINWRSHACFHS